MKHFWIKWGINALGIGVAAVLIRGIRVEGFFPLILAAALLGIVNALLRPILILLTLPIHILTLGLFTLVVNGAMLWLVSWGVKGFDIQGFWPAVLGAIIISVISWILNSLMRGR